MPATAWRLVPSDPARGPGGHARRRTRTAVRHALLPRVAIHTSLPMERRSGPPQRGGSSGEFDRLWGLPELPHSGVAGRAPCADALPALQRLLRGGLGRACPSPVAHEELEIGRASCRERVYVAVVGASV